MVMFLWRLVQWRIAWFASRSTSSLPLIPICEGTHMNSIVFFELAIMLIICCEISFDGLGDSNEVKALRVFGTDSGGDQLFVLFFLF